MSAKEKKNKKRGLIFAFFFNAVLVALLAIPMIQSMDNEDPGLEIAEIEEQKIYTELPTEFEISPEENSNASSRPDPAPKSEPEPEPDPQPAPEEEPKEVVVDENSEEIPVPTPETPNDNEDIKPAPPKPAPDPKPSPNTNTNGNGSSPINSNGNSNVWSDDNGNGKFSRKVIHRDDRIKGLTKEHGTIVIRLAVDPYGRVVGAKYQKNLSSIKHDKLANAVMHYLKNYKFSRDYKVTKTQYCNFTITFDLDNKVKTKVK
jgi:outer membrane biosynthesis protein TonB